MGKLLEKLFVMNSILKLHQQQLVPRSHTRYLQSIKDINPSVVYDIGSNVLHWYRIAKNIWPDSTIICFDALKEVEILYKDIDFENCLLSDQNDKSVDFYYSLDFPGGSSYYKENVKINPHADVIYPESQKRVLKTITLDTVIANKKYPLPDLVKMDVQGSELDVLKGAQHCIAHTKDVILELQLVDYNKGAPKAPEVIAYMESIHFVCVAEQFSKNRHDADYHFKNKRML